MLTNISCDPVWQEHLARTIAAGITTLRYEETWAFSNPGKGNYLPVSMEGIIKFYEHSWWAGVDLPKHLTTMDETMTFVISNAKAHETAIALRERYNYLESLCQVLDGGLTLIQSEPRMINVEC